MQLQRFFVIGDLLFWEWSRKVFENIKGCGSNKLLSVVFTSLSTMATSEKLTEIVSERGRVLLVYNNFKFYEVGALSSGEQKWRCVTRKCNSKIYIFGSGCDRIISREDINHNHPQDLQKLQRQRLSNSAKRKAVEDISDRPSKVCHNILMKIPTQEQEELQTSDLRCVKRNIYNSRRKIFPSRLPKCHEEVRKFI